MTSGNGTPKGESDVGAHPEKAKSETGPTSGSRPPRNSEPLGDAEKSEFFADADLKTEPLTTKPATTEQPTTTKTATTEAVTAEAVTEEPVTEEPVTAEPVTAEPVTAEPVTEEPVTEEPVTEGPVTEGPVTAAVASAEVAETTAASNESALAPVLVDNYAEPDAPPVQPSPAPVVSADPLFAAPVTSAPPAAGAERDAVHGAPAEPTRTWRQNIGQAGYTLVPYWFVASGVLLGAGGVVEDKAIAGACGALAGVTAGLVYQNRARYYRRQAESLRDRLRTQRLESETAAASMRESMRALRTEVWELRLSARVFEMTTQFEASRAYDPEEKARIAALATQPLDLSELHDTPLAASVAADLAANRPLPAANVPAPAADVAASVLVAETDSPVVDLTKPVDSAEKSAEIDQSAEPDPAEPEVSEATTKDDEPREATASESTADDDVNRANVEDVAGAPVDDGEQPGSLTTLDATEDKGTEDKGTEDKGTEDKGTEDKGTEDKGTVDAVAEDAVGQDKARNDPAVEDDGIAEGRGARVIDLRGASNKPPSQQEHTAVAG